MGLCLLQGFGLVSHVLRWRWSQAPPPSWPLALPRRGAGAYRGVSQIQQTPHELWLVRRLDAVTGHLKPLPDRKGFFVNSAVPRLPSTSLLSSRARGQSTANGEATQEAVGTGGAVAQHKALVKLVRILLLIASSRQDRLQKEVDEEKRTAAMCGCCIRNSAEAGSTFARQENQEAGEAARHLEPAFVR